MRRKNNKSKELKCHGEIRQLISSSFQSSPGEPRQRQLKSPGCQFEPEHLGRNTSMAQIRQKGQVFHRDSVKN